ncbi:MAG TPA: hypothetical protein VFS25_24025 [Chitinophaga sp.]|uniref:hypothetical protein n=1 Tax=Chitinophaga sp. TaxID=1869181 RepID=UPI002DBB187C|nr:hypothetical protein [Chitinophaga sp.]HEU4555935.1 hypothetical protein [Chitinophaga sp.]
MNTYRIFICIVFPFFMVPAASKAQFLKKLGNSVKQVAKEAVSNDNSADNAPYSNTSSTDHTTPGSKAALKAPAPDFEKQGIAVMDAGSAAYNAGQYFIEQYSSVTPSVNGLKAIVAVGLMTGKERLSELGEGSGNDVAYIYENGRKTQTTTVGKLDGSLLTLNKKYDWYAMNNVVNTGNESRYIKKSALSVSIVFNGKKYGPYKAVTQMIISKDNTKFFATVCPTINDLEQQKNYLLSNDGKLKPIAFGGDLLANRRFTTGCMILSPVTAIASRLAKEEDEKKQAVLQQQMTDAMMNHQNENDVIFFSGRELKGVITEYKWLDNSGNNLFSTKTDAGGGWEAGLYLNGKKIANDKPHEGHAWCNADATSWAYGSLGEVEDLVFKDGTRVSKAYHPRQIEYGGKSYLVWFMYDRVQSAEIKMCSKAL